MTLPDPDFDIPEGSQEADASLVRQEVSADQLAELRALSEESLFFFAKAILGYDWLTPHIHLPFCETLQDDAKSCVDIVLPRGWLKSTIASISYPLWMGVKDPNVRCLLAQNTFTNACKKLQSIKVQVETNGLLRALWPEVLPTRDCTWKTEALCLNRTKPHAENTFEAAGTRTKVTSRHYDLIIEDDTVAPDLDDLSVENVTPTKDDVDQAIGWHRLVPPLLVDPSRSKNVVVGTRWFVEDTHSWIQANEPHFEIITRACKEDENGNPSEQGEITYPERFDQPVLDRLRISMGSYMFTCLYLNIPVRSEDMVFRPEWFVKYQTESSPLMCYTSVDLAGDPVDSKGDPDYNVVMTCGKNLHTGLIYVLDYFHERCSPGELIDALFKHVRMYSPVKTIIEGVAYQKSIAYWIRERMSKTHTYFSFDLINQKRAKGTRIQQLQPMIENGIIQFRPTQVELMTELQSFPLGANDDLPDCLAMQIDSWAATALSSSKPRQDVTEGAPLEEAIESIHRRQTDVLTDGQELMKSLYAHEFVTMN